MEEGHVVGTMKRRRRPVAGVHTASPGEQTNGTVSKESREVGAAWRPRQLLVDSV